MQLSKLYLHRSCVALEDVSRSKLRRSRSGVAIEVAPLLKLCRSRRCVSCRIATATTKSCCYNINNRALNPFQMLYFATAQAVDSA